VNSNEQLAELPRRSRSDVIRHPSPEVRLFHTSGTQRPVRAIDDSFDRALSCHPGAGALLSAVRVSLVIPARNEVGNLESVFARIPDGVAEVILVDGNSTDGTADCAKELRPDVIVLKQSDKGKGGALATGFRAATGDIIIALDADGSTDPSEIPRFVAALLTGADFVKGTRFAMGGGSDDATFIRRHGARALSGIVNTTFSVSFTDLCYGYFGFWRRCLDVIAPDCKGFEVETFIALRAIKAGIRVVEVPSFESRRLHGRSSLDARRDGLRVLRTIAAEWIRPR
jgi:glycosyltransferase involved in cell wall biosynthesis